MWQEAAGVVESRMLELSVCGACARRSHERCRIGSGGPYDGTPLEKAPPHHEGRSVVEAYFVEAGRARIAGGVEVHYREPGSGGSRSSRAPQQPFRPLEGPGFLSPSSCRFVAPARACLWRLAVPSAAFTMSPPSRRHIAPGVQEESIWQVQKVWCQRACLERGSQTPVRRP